MLIVTLGCCRLNMELEGYYKANSDKKFSRVTPLTYNQIRAKKPGYPYLKSSAAACRHLSEFCLAMAHQHLSGSEDKPPFEFPVGHPLAARSQEHNMLMVTLFTALVDYHRSCQGEPFVERDAHLPRRIRGTASDAQARCLRAWSKGSCFPCAHEAAPPWAHCRR